MSKTPHITPAQPAQVMPRTETDALRYLKAYSDAIKSLKAHSKGDDIRKNPGISVKLSAIHPRYEVSQREAMLPVMVERLLSLALAAVFLAYARPQLVMELADQVWSCF